MGEEWAGKGEGKGGVRRAVGGYGVGNRKGRENEW